MLISMQTESHAAESFASSLCSSFVESGVVTLHWPGAGLVGVLFGLLQLQAAGEAVSVAWIRIMAALLTVCIWWLVGSWWQLVLLQAGVIPCLACCHDQT